MKSKDILHFYLGQQVCRVHSDGELELAKMVGVTASEVEEGKTVSILDVGIKDVFHEWYVEETKLILRPLSSMTEEELNECNIDLGQILLAQFPKDAGLKFFTANQFAYLLSKGFDIFNLHESGECLYESDLTQPKQ
jgi:hypothetical protein